MPSKRMDKDVQEIQSPDESDTGQSAFKDLWGDLPSIVNVRTPKRLLSEQARALGLRTRRVLMGKVLTLRHPDDTPEKNIAHELSIIAPFLNNYEVAIVRVVHPLISMYPLTLSDLVKMGKSQKCSNEVEYEQALKAILQSGRMHQIINALLTQSKDFVD